MTVGLKSGGHFPLFSWWIRHCPCVCLSVYPHDISKTAAARIPKLYIKVFYNESWKLIYCGIKRSSLRGQKKTVPAWVFALLWVLVSSSLCFTHHESRTKQQKW